MNRPRCRCPTGPNLPDSVINVVVVALMLDLIAGRQELIVAVPGNIASADVAAAADDDVAVVVFDVANSAAKIHHSCRLILEKLDNNPLKTHRLHTTMHLPPTSCMHLFILLCQLKFLG